MHEYIANTFGITSHGIHNNELLTNVLNASFDGIIVFDEHCKIIQLNPAAERNLGYSSKDVYDKDLLELFLPVTLRDTFSTEIRRYLESDPRPPLNIALPISVVCVDGSDILVDVVLTCFSHDVRPVFLLFMKENLQSQNNNLINNDERFRSTFEFAPFGMGIGDSQGNVMMVNKAFCQMSGYSEQELLNKNFREFIHPDDMALSVQNLTRLFAGEIDFYRQTRRISHKNGEYFWVEVNVSSIKDNQGKPIYLINHLRDITQHQRLENIQQSRTLTLELLAKNDSLDNILQILCDSTQDILSEARISILLLDEDRQHLIHAAATDLPNFYCEAINGIEIGLGKGACAEAAATGKPVIMADIQNHPNWASFLDLIIQADLKACWSVPIIDRGSNVLGTFAIYYSTIKEPEQQDIEFIKSQANLAAIALEHKHDKRILVESEARFRSSFEHGPIGMVIADIQGNMLQVNKNITETFGYSEKELLMKNFKLFIHPDELELTLQDLRRLLSGEIDYYRQTRRYFHKQGHLVWVDINTSRIDDSEGKPKYLISHLQDVTERIQSEYLQEAQRKILDEIVTGVSQKEILNHLCLMFESMAPTGAKASILLLNSRDNKLYVGAAPNLTETVKQAFEGFMMGECKASCGTAAFRGEKVIVDDVSNSELWADYKEFALENKILACWSTPFFSKQNEVLGTFAISLPRIATPSRHDIERLDMAGYLASIVIDRRRSEQSLKISEQKFKNLFHENPSMYFTVDESAMIISVNKFGAGELGYSPDEMIGRSIFHFIKGNQSNLVTEHLQDCIQQPNEILRWEMQAVKKNKKELSVKVLARVFVDHHNDTTILLVCEDISEAKNLADKLFYQATHDGLTGLVNRYEFEKRLSNAIVAAKRDNVQSALCYIDLDRFKIINDTCGHAAGDKLLKEFSDIVSRHIRERDSLGRLGGDEFGLLIEHCPIVKVEQILRKLKDVITEFNFKWNDKQFKIGFSVGVVVINNNSGDLSDIIMSADNACYIAKQTGRNRVHVHVEGDINLENHRNEMMWTSKIQKALEENRFYLAWQSIVPIDNNDNMGFHGEFLLRMEVEQGNSITPDFFIPAAERYDLITTIDKHVVNLAFDSLNSNKNFLQQLYLCSINLSGASLADERVLEHIIQSLQEFNLPADKICFEITETSAIANINSAKYFIETLKELGCKFALDDFGSGLSSFGYLKSLPVDFIKIDGVFVKEIEQNDNDLAIVKSIHEIGTTLNKKTIAEFVENDAILKILKGIGVDYAQGYGIETPKRLNQIDISTKSTE